MKMSVNQITENGVEWNARNPASNLTGLRTTSSKEQLTTKSPPDDEGKPVDGQQENFEFPPPGRLAQSRGSDSVRNQDERLMSFFGSNIFQMVLRNPVTAHRFMRFCQDRECGENMEFLKKVCLISVLMVLAVHADSSLSVQDQ
jgi:hypothetical protein